MTSSPVRTVRVNREGDERKRAGSVRVVENLGPGDNDCDERAIPRRAFSLRASAPVSHSLSPPPTTPNANVSFPHTKPASSHSNYKLTVWVSPNIESVFS